MLASVTCKVYIRTKALWWSLYVGIDSIIPLVGIQMDCSKIHIVDAVVCNEVGPYFIARIVLLLFRHWFPIKPFKSDFEKMVLINGLYFSCHFYYPFLHKEEIPMVIGYAPYSLIKKPVSSMYSYHLKVKDFLLSR